MDRPIAELQALTRNAFPLSIVLCRKRAVHQTQTLDFLKDIVEKVPDPAGAAAAAPAAGGSSAEAGAGAAPLKRRESEEYGSGSAAESGDAVPKRRRKA